MRSLAITALVALSTFSALHSDEDVRPLSGAAVPEFSPASSLAQDPQPRASVEDQLKAARKEISELRTRLAITTVAEKAAQDAGAELVGTQRAFIQMCKLGSPMEHESHRRHRVSERLELLEKAQLRPVPEARMASYRATIRSVFSERNLERDRQALAAFLGSKRKDLDQGARDQVGNDFVRDMGLWGKFLSRRESVQRLDADRMGRAAAIEFPAGAEQVLASPVADDVCVLAAVAAEYVAAKVITLERVMKQGREK